MSNNSSIVFRSDKKDFTIVSDVVALSMISIGNSDGFNRAALATHIPISRIELIQPRGGKAIVKIKTANGDSLESAPSGRVVAKKLFLKCIEIFPKAEVFNMKNTGELVKIS